LPGHHLPVAALADPDVGEADAEIHRVVAGLDADPRDSGQDHRIAVILRPDVGRHHGGVDGLAGLHVFDEALLRIEPRRRMGIDQIVGNQRVQGPHIALRHRGHALRVERDDPVSVACHIVSPLSVRVGLSARSVRACLAGGGPR
jgi:hypothetical protein